MQIGCAKEIITPQLPLRLAGFAGTREAEDIYDDLYVKVVLAKVREKYYGMIACDLIGIDDLLLNRLGKDMERMGLCVEHFLVTATHTHSGPCGVLDTSHGLLRGTGYIFGQKDVKLAGEIAGKILLALERAMEDCQETRVRAVRGKLPGIGKNRNDSELPGNDDLFAAELIQGNGNKVLLVNFACHPTVFGSGDFYMSADFPGVADRILAEKGYGFMAYLNGSCGDISTRFTRQGKGAAEVERYGLLLADKIQELLAGAKEVSVKDIRQETLEIPLKLKKPDDPEHAREQLRICQQEVDAARRQGICGSALRMVESRLDGAQANLKYAELGRREEFYIVKISVFRLGEETFLGIPGELFSELSNSLQGEHVHFIGYANGYLGYFADMAAYDRMNYEALSSPFERGESEKMVK